ncbi:glycosyltransferase family 4 protein [Actinomyces sp. AC-19-1]|nr:glycosyltransferase family 4 protein [Actinomyces sp. AC-20-1]MCL3789052.1 glycosyltransferase family 4 protein [Actinomyces sp. 187325]MCL3794036.1 glycosyltransferase family 4 protein [Actinomyces sp. 217892]
MVVEQLWQPVPGGSGTYVVELARALRERGCRVAGLAAAHASSPSATDVGLPPSVQVRGSRLPRTALYESWNRLRLPRAESVLPGADVVHATTWAVPGTRLPLAVTVHDLAFLRSPEHFTRRGTSFFLRCLERTAAEADVVITPSQATADDCVATGIEAGRIEVIPHGVRTLPVTEEQVSALRTEHGLNGEYVLWTGTHEPRKNLLALLRAFSLLATDYPGLHLVLVGPEGWGDDAEERRLVEGLGGRVHVTGRLSDADLAAAYTGARAFCFPSHWEGFGLPVLEAMAYGAPVVTSRGTCMEEVCGDAGLLAHSTSPEEIARQLARAIGPAHDELRAAGLERAASFTWQASAAAHEAVYRALAEGLR